MGFKLYDFECPSCSNSFEELVDSGSSTCPCPVCGTEAIRTLSIPKLGLFSMADQSRRSEILRKRSEEHTLKELRKEPEKFGDEGIRRARRNQIRSK